MFFMVGSYQSIRGSQGNPVGVMQQTSRVNIRLEVEEPVATSIEAIEAHGFTARYFVQWLFAGRMPAKIVLVAGLGDDDILTHDGDGSHDLSRFLEKFDLFHEPHLALFLGANV